MAGPFPRFAALALASIFIGATAIGCGEAEGPSIVGVWETQKPSAPGQLVARADHSFNVTGSEPQQGFSGRWETHGHAVKLFRDIRQGGDFPFGSGGDGSIQYKLSQDLTTMTSGGNPDTITLKLVSKDPNQTNVTERGASKAG